LKRFIKFDLIHRIIFSCLCFLHIFFGALYLVSDSFTGRGFDESALYLIYTGIDGVGLSGFAYLIGSTSALLLLALYVCVKVGKTLSFLQSFKKAIIINLVIFAFLWIQPVSIIYLTSPHGLFAPSNMPSIKMSLILDKPVKLQNKPNFIYLYLEGFERTFLDQSLFPNLAPNLRRLERSAISFTNIHEVYGTSWTIAGMVASQCGLPLTPVPNANKPGTFMPNAYCLGDILKENGYTLAYLGGASLRFGGKDNFYKTHQFDEVLGREILKTGLPDPENLSHWGLYDQDTFRLISEQLDQLFTDDQPFAFLGLTLDTHPPNGYPSPICSSYIYKSGDNPMLNSLHCSDALVSKLIEKIKRSNPFSNTYIIIGSDHLMLASSLPEDLISKSTRRNLFFIIPPDGTTDKVDRHASTLDLAPTILGLTGSQIPGLNLGRNLFLNEKTLVERSLKVDDDIRLWSGKLTDFHPTPESQSENKGSNARDRDKQ
jgi:phosphoglycerol transferase